jgi:hypothetical protein
MITRKENGFAMCLTDEPGWEIQADQSLIIHQSGFRAEYRATSIYCIKHFPYEATIHDIRNWVMKAESLLAQAIDGDACD